MKQVYQAPFVSIFVSGVYHEIQIPAWATHVAVDESGEIYAFDSRPVKDEDSWDTDRGYAQVADLETKVKYWALQSTIVELSQGDHTMPEKGRLEIDLG